MGENKVLKRFKWTLLLSTAIIAIVIYPNFILLADPLPTAREQSQLNFEIITIIEGLLIFGITFNVVTEWFRVHMDHTFVENYRQANPSIPDKYFENVGGEGGVGGVPGGEGGEGGEGKGEGGHGGKGGKGGHG